jgi:hypothetical protein
VNREKSPRDLLARFCARDKRHLLSLRPLAGGHRPPPLQLFIPSEVEESLNILPAKEAKDVSTSLNVTSNYPLNENEGLPLH